jgi:lipoic acid synthetase
MKTELNKPKPEPRPDWLKVRLPRGERYFQLKGLVKDQKLNTVCEDARCLNMTRMNLAGSRRR